MPRIKVIGAGLAGSEAAYQLAKAGLEVDLYEMKGKKRHEAFKTDLFAELLCSKSLRSNDVNNAVGLLKEEMRHLDSLIMHCADETKVEAGSALAVDRDLFAKMVTETILKEPNITFHNAEVEDLDIDEYTIIAAGPLCEGGLSAKIQSLFNEEYLHFYDAIAPIIYLDSIDLDIAYFKSRYDKGGADYLNCPMDQAEFFAFYQEVLKANQATLHEFEKGDLFEGCMPFEEMAKRGYKTLLFGPMKPVGLEKDGKRPYAVVQLRQDDRAKTLFNIVGFQTHLKYDDQKRIIQMIPGLQKARFARYGVMHRNTYLNSPKILDEHFASRLYPKLYFAGQIAGVEGYVESAASGLYAALSLIIKLRGLDLKLNDDCMMGSMAAYISDQHIKHFVPMNANFGIYNGPRDKSLRAPHSLAKIDEFKRSCPWMNI